MSFVAYKLLLGRFTFQSTSSTGFIFVMTEGQCLYTFEAAYTDVFFLYDQNFAVIDALSPVEMVISFIIPSVCSPSNFALLLLLLPLLLFFLSFLFCLLFNFLFSFFASDAILALASALALSEPFLGGVVVPSPWPVVDVVVVMLLLLSFLGLFLSQRTASLLARYFCLDNIIIIIIDWCKSHCIRLVV